MRVSIHIPKQDTLGLPPILAGSLGAHILLLLAFAYLPLLLPSRARTPVVYTVDLVDLPPIPEPPSKGNPPGPSTSKGKHPEEPPEEKVVPAPKEKKPVPKVKKPVPTPAEKKAEEKEREPKPAPERKEPPETEPPPGATAPQPAQPPQGSPTIPVNGDPEGPSPSRGPGGGVPGAGGKPVQAGFDDATFRYSYYHRRMIDILRSQWSKPIWPPGVGGTLRAVVYFVVGRDGAILRSVLEESSGYPPLDLSALRAVRETRRLPPLPMQYENDSVGVRLVFELKPEGSP